MTYVEMHALYMSFLGGKFFMDSLYTCIYDICVYNV